MYSIYGQRQTFDGTEGAMASPNFCIYYVILNIVFKNLIFLI